MAVTGKPATDAAMRVFGSSSLSARREGVACSSRSDSTRLFVWPHHPDRLRVFNRGARGLRGPVEVALTWNVFRTLELVSPAVWLRD